MNDTFDPRKIETSEDQFKEIIGAINRHYCELTITAVNGNCPYGHKAGEKHDVSAMNTSSLCGALYTSIQHSIFALDYGGSFPWEKPNSFNALCPEMGKVEVNVKAAAKEDIKVLKAKNVSRDMTGKGFPGLDKYKVTLEVLGIERHCTFGHKAGDKFEVDPFNPGGVCGSIYSIAHRFIIILFAGVGLPWEAEPHIIHGACPDIYNVATYRLTREER